MKIPRGIRACVGVALLCLVIASPVHASVISDVFALLNQTASTTADAPQNAGLTALVINILVSVERGYYGPAVNKLNAFVRIVGVLKQSGQVAPGDADALISAANGIIAQLQSN